MNGALTTAETFTNRYELRLMDIGYDPAPFSADRGYATFHLFDISAHLAPSGIIHRASTIAPATEFEGRQFLQVIYEKKTGKHFFLSDTLDGTPIPPYTVTGDEDDPLWPAAHKYYPAPSSGLLYQGAEIPAFCGWLSKYNLTESDLANIPTKLVNLAFAVNANPTNFSGIALSITNMTVSPTAITGAFTFNAKNAAGTPTAVTKLNDPNAIVISTTDSLATPFSPAPASSLSLTNGTFEVNTTQGPQFLRLDLTPAELW